MPRIARAVARGLPHHITQRGNYRQVIFRRDADYLQYLEWLREYSKRYALEIWAYCLMSNHIHFVCVPGEEDSLARTFNLLHMRYAQSVHRRRRTTGHLWQGRFYSTILDEAHAYAAVRYVERNPVRAGMVQKAEDYRWSSAREHVKGFSDGLVSKECYLWDQIRDWKRYLQEEEDSTIIQKIRKCSLTGRPCGDEAFVQKLEARFGRRLKALSSGRPRKEK